MTAPVSRWERFDHWMYEHSACSTTVKVAICTVGFFASLQIPDDFGKGAGVGFCVSSGLESLLPVRPPRKWLQLFGGAFIATVGTGVDVMYQLKGVLFIPSWLGGLAVGHADAVSRVCREEIFPRRPVETPPEPSEETVLEMEES
jgi:hypothetical protein